MLLALLWNAIENWLIQNDRYKHIKLISKDIVINWV